MKIHFCAEKRWVKNQLREHGPGPVLGLPDLTLADALQMIDDDPRTFIPVGDGCTNRQPDGSCGGCPPT